MNPWSVIKIRGGPAERGHSYGEQTRELIQENIELYRQYFRKSHGVGWERVRAWAESLMPHVRGFDADHEREMQAIAEAAGVDLLDVVGLNARSSFSPHACLDGCTVVCHVPGLDGDDTLLLGQNWDNMAGLKAVLLRVNQPNKPEVLTLTEAGMLGKMGLNSAGLALCVSGLFAKNSSAQGVPIFCMMRKVLQCPTLSAAMGMVTGTVKDAPHNYMLASGEGAAVDIEAVSAESDLLLPDGGFLVHTNHFLSPLFIGRDEGRARSPGSILRLWRARQLLADSRGNRGVSDIKAVLSDHLDSPDSICRHGQSGQDGTDMRTKCAVIMEPAQRRLYLAAGNPCNTPLEVFGLD